MNTIEFLDSDENVCYNMLCQAAELFERICADNPQDPHDTYNFGHYIDAAKGAIILRGARRLAPDVLLPVEKMAHKNNIGETIEQRIADINKRTVEAIQKKSGGETTE